MRKTVIYSVLWMAALFSSCIKEGGLEAESKDTYVQLVISNAASRAGENTAPADPINRLRVYAFNAQGEKIGYLFRDGLNTSEGISLPMPLDKQQSGSEVYFYVLANDIDGWGLSETTPRANLNSMSFTRWEDNTVPALAPMVNNDNSAGKGGYQTKVDLTPTSGSKWVTVNVNIQHIIGRVRLMLKKEGNGDIVITRAAVIHRPDNYLLFTPSTVTAVTFNKNSDEVVDEFITNKWVTSTTEYEMIGQTYLAPNAYGSTDPTGDTYRPAYPDNASGDVGKSNAYILSIDYTVGGTLKHKDVYLPQVLRNRSIDVQGTLKSGSLNLAIQVTDWKDGGESDLPYEKEFSGSLTKPGNPVVGDAASETDAYAVVYGEAADTRHDLIFELNIEKPIGATWTANVSNGGAFEVVKLDGSTASGVIDGNPVTIILRPTSAYEADKIKETELYITSIINNNNDEENRGKQIINDQDIHPGDKMNIRVRQISLDEWNQLTSTQP
ncbi:hypothetical protein [Bacteroides ilei]|uniref:hypothetical protein n=1 Tax=Bacteroides ilei TaxID=1907658 RepID=UPI003AB3B60B